ncbi:hypothetical protein TREES_T100003177 [Tupaia chinensis]|uniref:Uncharacterized protein n=1 Tax=Tupaia chinensis TaxID=246437 RepID=L9KEX7_TUPCH|nr:hypothetical protein TREES_T100003177 [Tupaia chinensis]
MGQTVIADTQDPARSSAQPPSLSFRLQESEQSPSHPGPFTLRVTGVTAVIHYFHTYLRALSLGASPAQPWLGDLATLAGSTRLVSTMAAWWRLLGRGQDVQLFNELRTEKHIDMALSGRTA